MGDRDKEGGGHIRPGPGRGAHRRLGTFSTRGAAAPSSDLSKGSFQPGLHPRGWLSPTTGQGEGRKESAWAKIGMLLGGMGKERANQEFLLKYHPIPSPQAAPV